MADEQTDKPTRQDRSPSTATVKPPAQPKRRAPSRQPDREPPRPLPPYKVLLHNDDVNEMGYVVAVIRKLTGMEFEAAWQKMMEAHETGVALLLVTHKERAELYQEQFASCGLTVTIEPDE